MSNEPSQDMADGTGPPPPEVKYVETETVACDGGVLGHPRVFLHIGKDGTVECPYCDCQFIFKSADK